MSLVVLDSASPFIQFQPSNSDWVPWQDESGRSYAVASANGSRLVFDFYGTGVTLHGRSTTTYQIVLDDSQPTTHDALNSEDLVLFAADNLPAGNHHVSLMSQAEAPQQLLAFQQVTIQDTSSGNSSSYFDNRNASVFSYNGQWNLQQTKGVPNDTVTSLYHTTSQLGANVTFTVDGSTTVLVRGMLDANSGPYSVEIDGNSSSYNVSTSKLVSDTVIFYRGGLDPHAPHTIVLTNTSPDNKILSLTSVTVQQDSPPPETPSSPASAKNVSGSKVVIVCAVLGALLVLGALTYLGYRKRWAFMTGQKPQNRRRERPSQTKFIPPSQDVEYVGSDHHLIVVGGQNMGNSMVRSNSTHSGDLHTTEVTNRSDMNPACGEHSPPSSPSSSALFVPYRNFGSNEAFTPPHSPMSSTTFSTHIQDNNGTRTMTWSRRESLPVSETSSTALLDPDSKISGMRADVSTSSQKSRPLPSIPDSNPDDTVEEERDAGLYNEGTLMRLLSASVSSGTMRSDPNAPPPRYDARK